MQWLFNTGCPNDGQGRHSPNEYGQCDDCRAWGKAPVDPTTALRAAVVDLGADHLVAICLYVDTSPRGSGEFPGSIIFRPPLCTGAIEIRRLDDLTQAAEFIGCTAAAAGVLFARLTNTGRA